MGPSDAVLFLDIPRSSWGLLDGLYTHITSCPLEFMNPISIHTTWPPCPLRLVVPGCGAVGFPPAVLATNQGGILVLYKTGHQHSWLLHTSRVPGIPTLLLAIQQIHHFHYLYCCTVHLVDSLNITLPTNALIVCHLF